MVSSPDMSFAETYILASKVRSKLTREASNPKSSLRVLVTQANMLDNIMDHIAEETERRRLESTSFATDKSRVRFDMPGKKLALARNISHRDIRAKTSVTEYEVESDSDSDSDFNDDDEVDSDEDEDDSDDDYEDFDDYEDYQDYEEYEYELGSRYFSEDEISNSESDECESCEERDELRVGNRQSINRTKSAKNTKSTKGTASTKSAANIKKTASTKSNKNIGDTEVGVAKTQSFKHLPYINLELSLIEEEEDEEKVYRSESSSDYEMDHSEIPGLSRSLSLTDEEDDEEDYDDSMYISSTSNKTKLESEEEKERNHSVHTIFSQSNESRILRANVDEVEGLHGSTPTHGQVLPLFSIF